MKEFPVRVRASASLAERRQARPIPEDGARGVRRRRHERRRRPTRYVRCQRRGVYEAARLWEPPHAIMLVPVQTAFGCGPAIGEAPIDVQRFLTGS